MARYLRKTGLQMASVHVIFFLPPANLHQVTMQVKSSDLSPQGRKFTIPFAKCRVSWFHGHMDIKERNHAQNEGWISFNLRGVSGSMDT